MAVPGARGGLWTPADPSPAFPGEDVGRIWRRGGLRRRCGRLSWWHVPETSLLRQTFLMPDLPIRSILSIVFRKWVPLDTSLPSKGVGWTAPTFH